MEHVNVLIVGAGISGIGAACHLLRKNPHHTFTILEGRDAIGGTWDLFRYPGIRSDSDMYTFGYSFKPWVEDKDIATGDAILKYLNETVDEYGVREHIRFGHRVNEVRWSSAESRWVASVTRTSDGERFEISCDFLLTCTGYYRYDRGYLPKFEGFERYEGVVAHPQHWPEDLDYAGKRVLVIGSGATAMTIVPTMAQTAQHVTMLQRSPTYVVSRPAVDGVARFLRRALPSKVAYRLTRLKNIVLHRALYKLARARPKDVRRRLRNLAKDALGSSVDVDVHFNPSYDPWDQRICLIPDEDLYVALREGRASVVTDTIERFTPTGVVLTSGETIEADIVVPATGLELQFLGGIRMKVDDRVVESGELVTYRGFMFAGVPNWAAVFGYTSASWTLKSDMITEYVCRMLRYMRSNDYDVVTPAEPDATNAKRSMMAKLESAGYVQRAIDYMPKQGSNGPWVNHDDYGRDLLSIKWGRLNDGVLRFSRRPAVTAAA